MMPPGVPDGYKDNVRMALRANGSVERSFSLFLALVAGRTPPEDAIRLVEEAMEVWTPYEDRNRMEMPEYPFQPAPSLPITLYAVTRTYDVGMLEWHEDDSGLLSVYTSKPLAENLIDRLNKRNTANNWEVRRIGAMFIDPSAHPAPQPAVIASQKDGL